MPNQDSRPDIAFAYVGTVVPDEFSFHNPAFSRAGNMFQENFLAGLSSSGMPPSVILSQRPLPSFPKSRVFWPPSKYTTVAKGLPCTLFSFINLPVLRPIMVGLKVVIGLFRWRWRLRNVPNRVVCTYNLTEPSGLFVLLGARLVRAKAVAAVIDVNLPGQTVPYSWARRLDFWLQMKLIPRFDGIIVVNKKISQDFAPRVPFVRVDGGVTDEVLQRSFVQKRELDAPFTVVSTGSLDDFNGFNELLEAFSLLPGKQYRLRIAGSGPLEINVRQAAERDQRIEYCGYLSFDQVLALYDTADVLVNMRLTKKIKTDYFFPSKIFEYLASGVPVISTCTGHVEEEYGDFVFLLRDESPQGLAHTIERVASLDPDERAKKARAAQNYIQTHNKWEMHGEHVVEFIRERIFDIKVKGK